jgi:hypothetical protein
VTAPEPGPSRHDRRRLVGALQAQALTRDNPLAANLGVLTGDLMLLAHGLAEQARAAADPPPGDRRHPPPDVDTFLKVLRQVDRLAQVTRQAADDDGA